jgi:hypothetical protein
MKVEPKSWLVVLAPSLLPFQQRGAEVEVNLTWQLQHMYN